MKNLWEKSGPQLQETLEKQGVILSTDFVRGKKVFLFPGHGAQYPNMMSGLLRLYPVVQEVFRRADQVYSKLTGEKLTSLMFDAPGKPAEVTLEKPVVMQPAIYTATMAMFYLVDSLGWKADTVLGHSLGEFAALTAAGVLSFEEGLRAVYARAEAVEAIAPEKRGSMISVNPGRDPLKVLEMLSQVQGCYIRSIVNAPDQWVFSGEKEAVAQIDRLCGEMGIRAVPLPVTHAFHSELLASSVPILEEKLQFLAPSKPACPVLSTVVEDYYSHQDWDSLPNLLAGQLTKPFDYAALVQRSYHEGARVFIEIGPKTILTNLTKKILGDKRDVLVINTNSQATGDLVAFARFEVFCRVHGVFPEIINEGKKEA